MKIKIKLLRRIIAVKFPKGIDYHKLAAAAGVRDMTAWNWLKNGKIAERYLPMLIAIPLDAVKKEKTNGNRKKH